MKHVRAIAHVTDNMNGQPVFVGALQDVTEAKAAEEALNRARAELAHVSRVTTVSALTASIAHEVNQPLSGIITNAGTCLRMLAADPPDVEGARETARRTIRDGNRASDVITRLRALFSKREFTLEPLDMNDVTREVVALSMSDLQRNRIVLQSEFADDLPPITGDRIQLQQVILNLLRNASDAMVGVDDRPRQLLIRTARDADDRVRVTVRDAGVGLDAPEHDQAVRRVLHDEEPRAWASGSPSAAPSSRNITVVCGQSRTTAQAPRSRFPFPFRRSLRAGHKRQRPDTRCTPLLERPIPKSNRRSNSSGGFCSELPAISRVIARPTQRQP